MCTLRLVIVIINIMFENISTRICASKEIGESKKGFVAITAF